MLVLHANLNFATSMQIFEKLSLHVQIEIDYIRILLAGRRANLFSNTNSLIVIVISRKATQLARNSEKIGFWWVQKNPYPHPLVAYETKTAQDGRPYRYAFYPDDLTKQ